MELSRLRIRRFKALVEGGYLVSGCIVMAAVPPAVAGLTVELLEQSELREAF